MSTHNFKYMAIDIYKHSNELTDISNETKKIALNVTYHVELNVPKNASEEEIVEIINNTSVFTSSMSHKGDMIDISIEKIEKR